MLYVIVCCVVVCSVVSFMIVVEVKEREVVHLMNVVLCCGVVCCVVSLACAEEAVQHLSSWLSNHPQYGHVSAEFGPPPESSQLLSHVVSDVCLVWCCTSCILAI